MQLLLELEKVSSVPFVAYFLNAIFKICVCRCFSKRSRENAKRKLPCDVAQIFKAVSI